MSSRAFTFVTLSFVALAALGCSGSKNSAGGSGADGGTGAGGSGDGGLTTLSGAGGTSVFPTNALGQVLCGETPCQCSDGIDNDGDGLSDGLDPECTGAYDDVEETFATGIPGDNMDAKKQDCFFDGNSGQGDDHCSTECFTAGGTGCNEAEKAACLQYCLPRTPNGCDCFGCCTLTTSDGATHDVRIGSDCSLAVLESTTLTAQQKEAKCAACTKVSECVNVCGRCEICAGKTAADIPADCTATSMTPSDTPNDGSTSTCAVGQTACPNGTGCPAEASYCWQGCCVAPVG